MIQRRYQWRSNKGLVWTSWFKYTTNKSLKELQKTKPLIKSLKEEYREI